MSTITSPRLSITTPTSSHPSSPSLPPRRANRAALRDYYNLRNAAPVDANSVDASSSAEEVGVKESELDAEGFDAEAYVREVLGREGLEGVLGRENALIGEIRGLDGERKALVYDNYSRLIVATDTIRKMRANMDPLTPTTSTLAPAISHIAETAASLATELQGRTASLKTSEERRRPDGDAEEKGRQRETVRWILAAPRRLSGLVEAGRREEAVRDWREVRGLLGEWEGVRGVDEVREACEEVMGEE